AKRLAVRHSADSLRLQRQARRSGGVGWGAVRCGAERRGRDQDQSALRAEGCGTSAVRSRGPQDDGYVHPHPLSRPPCSSAPCQARRQGLPEKPASFSCTPNRCILPLEFPLEFLKLFQVGCRFPTEAGRAYDTSGNTEHIRVTGWEAL